MLSAALPENNISPLKIGLPKTKCIFQTSIFRCYVRGRWLLVSPSVTLQPSRHAATSWHRFPQFTIKNPGLKKKLAWIRIMCGTHSVLSGCFRRHFQIACFQNRPLSYVVFTAWQNVTFQPSNHNKIASPLRTSAHPIRIMTTHEILVLWYFYEDQVPTRLGTNISQGIFSKDDVVIFPWWDMLVSWWVSSFLTCLQKCQTKFNDLAHIPWEDTPNFPKPHRFERHSFIHWNGENIRGAHLPEGAVGEICQKTQDIVSNVGLEPGKKYTCDSTACRGFFSISVNGIFARNRFIA